ATIGFSWPILGLFAFYMAATGLSITGGYHRLFSHQSYQTTAPVRAFYLIFGAAACQNSALKWSSDHRYHHLYVDQDRDPYNIGRGFFWAHIGWIFFKRSAYDFSNVQDLKKDPLVVWQNRYYVPLAIGVGGVLPLLFGWAVGDWWGGFLLIGVARTVIVHHSTFLINSLCHYLGRQPYSTKDSSRDSGLVALLTYGEGYHNFHHHFQYDYRNGIRWFDWDPTKWLINTLAAVGWADRLRTAKDAHIFQARLEVQRETAKQKLAHRPQEFRSAMENKLHAAHDALVAARAKWEHLRVEYSAARQSMDTKRRQLAATIKQELAAARLHFQNTHASWNLLLEAAGA
ncbi:MAG TPA: fatty acid desaturase, partial [Nitrospiria bacterium]|nr:fatty acid desaturase [Nitrospiria bacterium]